MAASRDLDIQRGGLGAAVLGDVTSFGIAGLLRSVSRRGIQWTGGVSERRSGFISELCNYFGGLV